MLAFRAFLFRYYREAAYGRILDASVRLQLRVEWGDTLHAPVGHALSRAQEAWNVIVLEDPHGVRSEDAKHKISRANSAASTGYEELMVACRKRFSPEPLPGTELNVSVVFSVEARGPRLDEIVTILRKPERYRGKVTGPTKENRLVVGTCEGIAGEAQSRVIAVLDEQASDWRTYLAIVPPS